MRLGLAGKDFCFLLPSALADGNSIKKGWALALNAFWLKPETEIKFNRQLKLTAMRAFAIFMLVVICCSNCFAGRNLNTLSDQVPDLIQPVQLNIDTTILYLNDFFIDPSKIDSISTPNGVTGSWNKVDNTYTIVTTKLELPLTELKLWNTGKATCVVLKRSAKRSYRFTFNPQGKAYQTVQLAGEMNDWTPKKNAFVLQDGKWIANVDLNPGVYQYQLVLDGKWAMDPANHDSASNGNGGFNSVFKTPVHRNADNRIATTEVTDNGFKFTAGNDVFSFYAYWNNQRISITYSRDGNHLVTVKIPPQAKQYKRSWCRVFSFNGSSVGNDLLIPLEYGKVITAPKQLDRTDKQAMSIYSIFVDRFYDGDSSNDKPVVFAELKPKANFYGGDLAGVTDKIKVGYFDSLHVNTLWISPILQNPEGAYKEFPEPHDWYTGYHGYWPISLSKIDHRFGNDATLKSLVSEAHKMHDNVLIDLVANHVHEESPIYKQHPDWATQLNLPDGRKNIRLWDEYRLTTWFDTFLPTLDFSKPEVVKLEVDSSLLWIEKFGVDGFRHDATKHIMLSFWRSLTLNLKKIEVREQRPLYQIGETYGSKELVGSYIGSGLLDGQFDFNLFFDARAAFAKDSEGFEKVAATLQQSIDFYGSHHLMGNITGNHDQPRFASLAGGGLSFTEDARKAGWDRDVNVGKDIAYNKLACMVAFITTIPGVPVLYYGDEIGMPGAGDPDNRRMMRFGNLSPKELQLKQKVAGLFALRQQHMALTYGDFKMLKSGHSVMAYSRQYFDDEVVVVFNYSDSVQTIELTDLPMGGRNLEPQYKSQTTYTIRKIAEASTPAGLVAMDVKVAPKSFEIFVAKAK